MNYQKLIREEMSSVYTTKVANDILQRMDKIRNESSIDTARRWVIELIQNACDVRSDIPLEISITYKGDEVRFSHNGKPFRVKDILSIINQVSSKADDEETVGKFGTGFASTFQLSPEVTITSVLHNDGGPYVPFKVKLVRSGETKDSVEKAIAQSMSDIEEQAGNSELDDFDQSKCHTTFSYEIVSKESREAAIIGINDFKRVVPIIFLNFKELQTVTLTVEDEVLVFSRGEDYKLSDSELRIQEIFKDNEKLELLYNESDDVAIIGFIKDKKFLPLEDTPRLYIAFPLIGSEEFPFPVIISSTKMRPNEPRSGIALTDNSLSTDSKKNKEIVSKAIEMFSYFVNHSISEGFDDIFNICNIPAYAFSSERSESYVKNDIYDKLWNIIKDIKVTSIRNESATIGNSLFISDTEENSVAIKELCAESEKINICAQSEEWLRVLSNYESFGDNIVTLESILENHNQYYNKTSMSLKDWYILLCKSCLKDSTLKGSLLSGSYAVFVGMDGRLYCYSSLRLGTNIPDAIVKASNLADRVDYVLNITMKLFDREYESILSDASAYSLNDVLNHIKKNIEGHTYAVTGRDILTRFLLSESPETKLKEIFSNLMGSLDESSRTIEDVDIFYGVIKHILIKKILPKLNSNYFSLIKDNKLTIEDFNYLLSQFSKYNVNIDNERVFPTQNDGTCSYLKLLSLDNTTDVEIRDIARHFYNAATSDNASLDFDSKLLLKGIEIPSSWNISSMTDVNVYTELSVRVQHYISSYKVADLNASLQTACMEFYTWLDCADEDKIKSRFPYFADSEVRVQLLGPKAIAENTKAAKDTKNFFKEYGAESIDDMRKVIKEKDEQIGRLNRVMKSNGWTLDDVSKFLQKEEGEIIRGRTTFDFLNDVWFSEDDLSYAYTNGYERDDFLYRIGRAGELIAYQHVIDSYIADGYSIVEEYNTGVTKISKDDDVLVISYPDFGTKQNGRHQSGYDIIVTRDNTPIKYFEVKTRTIRSYYKNYIKLSSEQFRFALTEIDRYEVFMVTVDYDFSLVRIKDFHNPVTALRDGSLYLKDGLGFFISNDPDDGEDD